MSSGALDLASSPARILLGGGDAAAVDQLFITATAAGCSIVGRAETQCDLVELAISTTCDVIVVEVCGWSTAEVLATGEEVKIAVGLPLLVVGDEPAREMCRQARAAGIDGVLVKPLTPAQLAASVELVVGGATNPTGRSGTYALGTGVLQRSGVDELSAREREVFVLLAHGHRTSEISRELFISEHTVRKHAKLIFRKLGVHSQIELMRRHFGRVAPR